MGVEPVGFDVNQKLNHFLSIPIQNVPKHLFLMSISFTAHKFAFAMLANFMASWMVNGIAGGVGGGGIWHKT